MEANPRFDLSVAKEVTSFSLAAVSTVDPTTTDAKVVRFRCEKKKRLFGEIYVPSEMSDVLRNEWWFEKGTEMTGCIQNLHIGRGIEDSIDHIYRKVTHLFLPMRVDGNTHARYTCKIHMHNTHAHMKLCFYLFFLSSHSFFFFFFFFLFLFFINLTYVFSHNVHRLGSNIC